MKSEIAPTVLTAFLLAAPAPAPGQPLDLDAPRTFATSRVPLQVLPMDLDDDGDLDVAVRCARVELGTGLDLFENPGDGTLVLRATLDVPSTLGLIAADLNGDGRLDVATLTHDAFEGRLHVWLRTGPFAFAGRSQPLPFAPDLLAAGDLNGTGGLDLVMPDPIEAPSVRLYAGDGRGGFTPAGRYDTERFTRDVNGDGVPDTQCRWNTPDLALTDVDGDGDDDVVVTHRRRVVTDPLFDPRIDPALADRKCREGVTGVAETTNVVLLRAAPGGLAPAEIVAEGLGTEVEAGDVTGDGANDLAVLALATGGEGLFDVVVLANDGTGAFPTRTARNAGGGLDPISLLRLADVDADGDLDAALVYGGPEGANPNDPLPDRWALLRNAGGGALGGSEVYVAGADTLDLAFAPLDARAGLEALSVAGDDDRVAVSYLEAGYYPGPVVRSVDDPRTPMGGNTPLDVEVGDFDGDGRADLAVLTVVSVLLGDGPDALILLLGGATAPITPADLSASPTRMISGVFGGGAGRDLAIAFLGADDLGAGLPAGPEGVGLCLDAGPARVLALTGAVFGVAALDLEGDGGNDLAVLRLRDEGLTAGVTFVRHDGAGGLTAVEDWVLGNDDVLAGDVRMPLAVATGDVDGAGLADVVAVTWPAMGPPEAQVDVQLRWADGTRRTAGPVAGPPWQVTDAQLVDVTGDGAVDLLLTSVPSLEDETRDGALDVFVNQGGGNFAPPARRNVGTAPARVRAAELDGRPGMDLAVAARGSNEVTLLFNDGAGGFPRQARYLTGGGTDALALTDADGDGDLDVVAVHDAGTASPNTREQGTLSVVLGRRVANPHPGPTPAPDGHGAVNPPAEHPGGGGLCFVATEAYADPADPQVRALRAFRERFLRPFAAGRAAIAAYETHSPAVAERMRRHPSLRPLVRAALTPAVVFALALE